VSLPDLFHSTNFISGSAKSRAVKTEVRTAQRRRDPSSPGRFSGHPTGCPTWQIAPCLFSGGIFLEQINPRYWKGSRYVEIHLVMTPSLFEQQLRMKNAASFLIINLIGNHKSRNQTISETWHLVGFDAFQT